MVAQVGRLAGFGPEDVYDLKLAVTEAATNVIRHAAVESYEVEYRVFPRAVEITVIDTGGGFNVAGLTRPPEGQGGSDSPSSATWSTSSSSTRPRAAGHASR